MAIDGMMRAALTVGRLATSEASAAGHGGSRAAHAERIGDTLGINAFQYRP